MKVFALFFSFLVFSFNFCLADNPPLGGGNQQEEVVRLEEIVVTPYAGIKLEHPYDLPYTAKIYSNKDIENTGAVSVLDFLKTVPEVSTSDYYGNGIKATVDMMGFGDNASSNILVLVNGRRINAIDLSGIDWTQLPLNQIKQIEVLKGGGSVVYGDNAAGGVINIISEKQYKNEKKSEILFKGGSYNLNQQSISFLTGNDNLFIEGFGEHHSTDGYRENSHYRSKYASLITNFKLSEDTEGVIDLSHHNYVYGLPGDLTQAQLSSGYSRRDSADYLDNVSREDNSIGLNVKNKFSDFLTGSIDIFFRNRNELSQFLTNFTFVTDKHVSTFQVRPEALLSFDLLGFSNDSILGFEFYSSDLSSEDSSSTTDITRRSLSWFLQNKISVSKNISASLGLRLQEEKFDFDYRGSSVTDQEHRFNENLYEAGVNYNFAKNSNIYFNFARGLRVGKTDEYLVTFPSSLINTNLKPQVSRSYTIGLNTDLTRQISASLDYFYMDTEDEIYYDPNTFSNKNYPETKRHGVNFNLDYFPFDHLTLNLGYRYIDAEFGEGSYNGKEVPFVPNSIVNASLKYDFLTNFSLYVDYMYRGKTYLINDLNNISPKLDGFNVVNLKLSYLNDNVEISFGINNLFNELYSEYAVTNIAGTSRGYYPSPERNYFGTLKIKF